MKQFQILITGPYQELILDLQINWMSLPLYHKGCSYKNNFLSNRIITNLSNRKQFILYNQNKQSEILQIQCGVTQGSILGQLLFLVYVNDLYLASNILEPITFADDTNLFYSHKDIKTLFNIVNNELIKIS